MAIEIHYEQFIENGEPKVKIDKLKALSKERLPELYFRDEFSKGKFPVVCYWTTLALNPKSMLIIDKFTDKQFTKIIIQEGEILHKKDFEYYLSLVHEAGKRLMKINKKLRKENKSWYGKKKLKI